MEIDLSLTITSIIAIMALISPIITFIINNHYEIKKNNIKQVNDQKREALNNFIVSALNFYAEVDRKYSNMSKYTIAKNNLYLYFKNVDRYHFIKLDEYREEYNIKEYKEVLNELVIDLSKEIPKY